MQCCYAGCSRFMQALARLQELMSVDGCLCEVLEHKGNPEKELVIEGNAN